MMKKRVYGFLLVGLIFAMLVLPMVLAVDTFGDKETAPLEDPVTGDLVNPAPKISVEGSIEYDTHWPSDSDTSVPVRAVASSQSSSGSSKIGDSITKFLDTYITEPIGAIAKYAIGGSSDGEQLLVKILFFILIIMIAYYAASAVPGLQNYALGVWVVSLIVAILGTRYLTTPEMVNFAWLPTGVLGVVFMTLLPFILFVFFIDKIDHELVRKVGWVTYIVLFIGLAFYRWGDLALKKDVRAFGTTITANSWWANLGWFYVIIAVLSILCLIFDKKLRARMHFWVIKKNASKDDYLKAEGLLTLIDKWEAVKTRAITSNNTQAKTDAEAQITKFQEELAKLDKSI